MKKAVDPKKQLKPLIAEHLAKNSYKVLLKECLKQVVCWRRASNEMLSFPPFDIEMRGDSIKGKWLGESIPASRSLPKVKGAFEQLESQLDRKTLKNLRSKKLLP